MYEDIEKRMVSPMKADFAGGDIDAGVGDFIDYVFAGPGAWRSMSAVNRAETLRDAREWTVMMTNGVLFPDLAPAALRADHVPFLLMSGAKSYPFLGMIDEELTRLLPDSRRMVLADSGRQMWMDHPDECRKAAELFFGRQGGPARPEQ
jgi:pimeloyl-ACP methyl ester carboxylesterase